MWGGAVVLVLAEEEDTIAAAAKVAQLMTGTAAMPPFLIKIIFII